MTALPVEIALLSKSAAITADELRGAAETYLQYVRDKLSRDWRVAVTAVNVYDDPAAVPVGCWPITWQDQLDDPGAAGYHLDENNQPSALCEATDGWLFTGSHELAEMLVDPTGNHVYRAASPDPNAPPNTPVGILLEVCDPSEDPQFGLTVNGQRVSDYYLHSYAHGPSAPWSKSGAIEHQRQVLTNGYISYVEIVGGRYGDWKQLTNFEGEGVKVADLGPFSSDLRAKHGSLRAWVDAVGPARERARKVITAA